MSILETFFVMFKADSSDLKKGVADVDKTVSSLASTIKSQLAGIFSIGAFVSGSKMAMDFANHLGELSDSLNVDASSMSAWGDAIKLSGGSAEGFAATVSSMTAALADFATKGNSRAAPFFQQLGIRMVDAKGKARSFLDLLPELADRFSKISKSESLGIGQKMGLDLGTIMLLQRGKREVDELIKRQKELGVVTKQDGEIAGKFGDSWDDLKHIFRSFFVTSNSMVLPVLTAMIKGFSDLIMVLMRNKYIVVLTIAVLSGLALAFAPITTILGALGALFALVYEDIVAFNNGQKSLIGYMLTKYPELSGVLQVFGEFFKGVWGGITLVIQGVILLIVKLFEAFDNIISGTRGLSNALDNVFLSLWEGIKATLGLVTKAIDAISNGVGKIKGFFGGSTELSANLNSAQQSINTAQTSPINRINSNSIANANQSTKNTTVSTGDITIQTQATDAKGIAGTFGKSLSDQIRQAMNTSDDGVYA